MCVLKMTMILMKRVGVLKMSGEITLLALEVGSPPEGSSDGEGDLVAVE